MIWRLILGNRVVRFIGGALAAVLAILCYGGLKYRQGRVEARKRAEAQRQADNLKAERERVVLDAEIDATDDLVGLARKSGVVRPKANP